MRRRTRAVSLAAAYVTLSASLWPLAALGAPSVDADKAVVVAGSGERKPLGEGGSATAFSLRLPSHASCQGDSAHDNYRVSSYMVPVSDDPAAVHYMSEGPEGPGRFPLYDFSTRPFTDAQTADADTPGKSGPIVDIATFSFGVYAAGEFPPGRYNIGIACTLFRRTTRFWNAQIVVLAAPDDKPAGVRWVAIGTAPAKGGRGGSAAFAAGVAALGAAAVWAGWSRRQHRSGRRPPRRTQPLEES